MNAEIISIGDELTSGQRLDTNSQWLSERLGEVGIDVAFHTTVGDELADNVAVFRAAIDRADVVISTGGIGPTADDLTREAIAAAVGVELVEDAAALLHIRQLFERRGRSMPERNAWQAQFPHGSCAIPNSNGTAPGIDMTIERPGRPPCWLFALPGVPAELFAMWAESVAPAVIAAQAARRVTRHHRIKCFGTGESHLESMLPDLIRRGREPRVGITVSDTTITLRITASGPDEAACLQAMEPTIAQIRDSLGVLVFGEEEDELQQAVVRLLDERRKSVAVAESASDGLVSYWLADAAGESDCFRGGEIVRDATDDVAEMARAIRERSGADYGLAIGGWPDTELPTKLARSEELAGELPIAVAAGENVRVKHCPLSGHPALVRTCVAKQALNLLRLTLLNQE
jgi:nicotinamide-nucleotide amidase